MAKIIYHKSGFPLLYIVRIPETCKTNEVMKWKLELQIWIFPPQKFTCTYEIHIHRELVAHEQSPTETECMCSQLFLLLQESFCSCFVPAVFRNWNLKGGQTFKNRNLSKQAMCETDLAMLFNRILFSKNS